MALTKSFAAVAILSSLTMAAPAFAQARTRGGRDGGGDHGNRGGGRVERSAPRPAPSGPRADVYRGPRTYGGGRSYNGPVAVPRTYSSTPRFYNDGRYRSPRAYSPRVYSPRVYSPRVYSPRVYAPRVYAPRYYARGYVPRVYGPLYRSYGYHYRGYPSYIYRPYLFRPHFSIGFGFFVGYPVPYTYSYPVYYPVPYPVPYPAYPSTSYPSNPYPPDYQYQAQPDYSQQYQQQGSIDVQPGPTNAGGVTFEVNPPTAQVLVDGEYVGTVETFDGSKQPLTLGVGQHRIELRATGYETVTFDVNVIAGQVIPYRGDMRPSGRIE